MNEKVCISPSPSVELSAHVQIVGNGARNSLKHTKKKQLVNVHNSSGSSRKCTVQEQTSYAASGRYRRFGLRMRELNGRPSNSEFRFCPYNVRLYAIIMEGEGGIYYNTD